MPPPRIGSNEILRTIVGILAVVNIACFLYYFVVHRPAADVVLQTQLAHVARVKDAASHTHVNDSLSHAARDWDVEDAAVARDPAVGVAYYQAHGLDHAHLGVSGAPWWSIRRAHSSGDEDVMAVVSPRLGAVPFAGPLWLPWLGERNVTSPPEGASLLPQRIPRDAVATALHLVLPPSVMIAATLNGTTPLHYHTHFRHPPKRLGGALHAEEAARWFQEEIIDGSPDANQTYLERKLVPKKRLVEILTALYHMIDSPNYDAAIRDARMQRAFVMAVKNLRSQIEGRDVLVYGTLTDPFVEIVMLAIGGARRIVSVDHVPFRTSDRRIVSLTPREFWRCVGRRHRQCPPHLPIGFHVPRTFDIVVAYSVVQHDGLGRFGDALDAFGDVKLMWELRSLLSPDPSALLFLGVPLGNDCVVFNRHRTYGRRRLPLLLLGFEVYQCHGFDGDVSDFAAGLLFSDAWAHDNRCLGDSQRIPLIVLQRLAAGEAAHSVTAGASSPMLLPSSATQSWFRIPGLAGPYPLHT